MRNTFLFKPISLSAMLFLSFLSLHGTTIYSASGGGDWNNTASWSPAQVPTSSDSVVITSGNPITTSTIANANGLFIQSGASLSSTSYWALNIYGNFKIDGSFSWAHDCQLMGSGNHISGAATIAFSGTLWFYGSYTIDAGVTINASGTLEGVNTAVITNLGTVSAGIDFYGTGGKWVNGTNSNLSLYADIAHVFTLDASATGNTVTYTWISNQIWPSTGGYYNLNFSGLNAKTLISDVQVNGYFNGSINSTFDGGHHTLFLAGSAYTAIPPSYVVNLNVTFNGSGSRYFIQGSGSPHLGNVAFTGSGTVSLYNGLICDNVTVNSGTLDLTNISSWYIYGNWSHPGGSITYASTTFSFYPPASTTSLISSTGDGWEAFHNLVVDGAGVTQLGTHLYINGNLTIDAGTLNGGTRGDTIALAGNWTNYGNAFIPGQSTIQMQTTGTKTISKTSGTETFYNLTEKNSGGATNLTNSCPVSCLGNFTVNYQTVTLGAPLSVVGNILVNSGTTFNSGAYPVTLGGNWTNNGTWSSSTGSLLTMNGSGTQTVQNSSGSETFRKLTLNKSGGTVQLNNPLTVPDTLHLIRGTITTTSSNILQLNAGTGLLGGSDTAYVSGPMKKVGNTAFTFPLGSTTLATGAYHPLVITAPANATDQFVAQYFATNQGYGSTLDDSLKAVSNCEYWTLTQTNGSSVVTASLGWNSSSCNITNFPDLRVALWNGTKWLNQGVASLSANGKRGIIKAVSSHTYNSTPTGITIANFKTYDQFAFMQRKLDGGYNIINDGKLLFRYDEEYNDLDGNLSYKIFDKSRNVLAQSGPSSPIAVHLGDNRYLINILDPTIGPSGGIGTGTYTLEVTNEKNEVRMLRFQHTVSTILTNDGLGGQTH